MIPKGDRVIVRKLELADEVTTPGGLVLPEAALEQLGAQPIGVVIAVGPDVGYLDGGDRRRVEAGEIVLYQRHGGTEVTIEGMRLLVFRESEILAGLDELEASASLVDLPGIAP